jgi:hypothetical protein
VRDLRGCVALAAQFGSKLASQYREDWVVMLVARRQTLCAFNRQVRQLPEDLQHRECGLIEVGRRYARDFDAGHFASGTACHRVLIELSKLAERMASQAAEAATPGRNAFEDIRARRAARLTGIRERESPAVDHERAPGDC